jgi:hypothetical protein
MITLRNNLGNEWIYFPTKVTEVVYMEPETNVNTYAVFIVEYAKYQMLT